MLSKEHRLRVFENRVLRRICGPKRDEVTGEWKKLHTEDLHNLYSSPVIIRQIKSRGMRWMGHVAHMGEERKLYKVLVGKPEGKRPLGRPRHRWEDKIRIDLRELAWGVWTGFDWLRVIVSVVMNRRILAPQSYIYIYIYTCVCVCVCVCVRACVCPHPTSLHSKYIHHED
jgi:hypothetical protein